MVRDGPGMGWDRIGWDRGGAMMGGTGDWPLRYESNTSTATRRQASYCIVADGPGHAPAHGGPGKAWQASWGLGPGGGSVSLRASGSPKMPS